MKNLLKFSVKWERLDDRHLVLRLVNADSIESRLKPEEETLEAFAEGIETLGFLLNDKDAELRRGEVVTLEFVGNDLKYFYSFSSTGLSFWLSMPGKISSNGICSRRFRVVRWPLPSMKSSSTEPAC